MDYLKHNILITVMSQTYSDVACATSETNTLAAISVSSPRARAFMLPDVMSSQFPLSYYGYVHTKNYIFYTMLYPTCNLSLFPDGYTVRDINQALFL